MEYVYAALILNETGEEINEENLKSVIEASGASADESRVKALVAALEGVDIDEAVEEAAAVPAAGGSGGGAAAPAADEGGDEGGDDEPEADDDEGGDDEPEGDDDDEEASGEGLGELFG
jgi:large subunit ribosomal protein L12